MGLTQTKLHNLILDEDWKRCIKQIERSEGKSARIQNPYGDTPLHLACYSGVAPPHVIRALIDAFPGSVQIKNNFGRCPLDLAARNYPAGHPQRAEVLALLRWHKPGDAVDAEWLSGIFVTNPPEKIYSTSVLCVGCLEEPSNVAMVPCGHSCLCAHCARAILKKGRCPICRGEVEGLYQLQEDQVQPTSECACGEQADST